MKTYLWASDSSRLTGPSKTSPPSRLSERRDHKGDSPGAFHKERVQRGHVHAALFFFWTPGTCFSLLRAEAGSEKGDKVLIVPFLPSFSTEVGGIEVKPLAFEDASLVTLHFPGSLPTSLRWLIKVFHHQTLMLTRFTGASAERIMSRYHRALTMVIEGQLCMPCKDTGSTATSMQDVKQLAACVPDPHVRQPATQP